MRRPPLARDLDAAHERLRGGVVEVQLDTLGQLLDADGRWESGLDELAGLVSSARRLPESIVVRVTARRAEEEDAVEDAYRSCCRARARMALREAVGMRRNGLRDLGPALLITTLFGLISAVVGYFAESSGSDLVALPLYVVAGICVIAAWASAWLPIEQVLFDWRASAHLARTYDLLGAARLELVRSSAPDEDAATSPLAAMPVPH